MGTHLHQKTNIPKSLENRFTRELSDQFPFMFLSFPSFYLSFFYIFFFFVLFSYILFLSIGKLLSCGRRCGYARRRTIEGSQKWDALRGIRNPLDSGLFQATYTVTEVVVGSPIDDHYQVLVLLSLSYASLDSVVPRSLSSERRDAPWNAVKDTLPFTHQ